MADTDILQDIERTDSSRRAELLRVATAGSVDDGKSTLIGRLLFDSKAVFEDQYEAVERASKGDYVDLALLTDGLRAVAISAAWAAAGESRSTASSTGAIRSTPPSSGPPWRRRSPCRRRGWRPARSSGSPRSRR